MNLTCFALVDMQSELCEVKQWWKTWDVQSQGTVLHTEAMAEAAWDTPSHRQFRHSCSVVVEALAGLLEVAVASLCRGESHLSQVLPVEGAAAQLLPLDLGPGPLDGEQLEVARQRDSPGSQTPGYVPPHCHRPGQTQGRCYSTCWWNTRWNTILERYSITVHQLCVNVLALLSLREPSEHLDPKCETIARLWVSHEVSSGLNLEITVNISIRIKIVLIRPAQTRSAHLWRV